MNRQQQINKTLDELSERIYEFAKRESDRSIDKIDSIRKQINGILADYSKDDGTISKSRINTLLSELDTIEEDMYEALDSSLDQAVANTSEQAEKDIIGALIAVLGITAVFGGLSKRPKSSDIVKEISDYVLNREIDGVTIRTRLAAVVGVMRDELQREIRYGVHIGLSITQISRRVKTAFDRTVWQFRRIITTEIPVAFRTGIALIGGKTGVIKAIKIIDNRGRHKYHETHECYRLAEQDKYGMGKGVYLPTDTYIFDPHPQCTAYYHYILNNDVIEGGN